MMTQMGCIAIEDGKGLEISDKGRRGIVLNRNTDQIRFSRDAAKIIVDFYVSKLKILH